MSAASMPGLTLAGEPRVQLLPPSVKQREKTRSARRMMGLLVVLALVVAGAGTGFAFLLTTQTEARLATAQEQTLQILAQQSEYSAGAKAAAQVTATESTLRTVTTNEVDWLQLSNQVLGTLPCACTITEIGVAGPAPWEPALIPEGPLRTARVAVITVTVESATYASAGDFARAVRAIGGVADVVITTTTLEDGTYRTQVLVAFDEEVLALRYASDGATADDATAEDEVLVDAGATPAPTPTEGAVP